MNYPACPVHHLPNFESIQPDTIEQEVAGKIKTAISAINAAATAKQMTAETLVFDLEEALEDLDQYWSAVSHLHAVANNEALREGYQKGQAKLTDFYSDLGQNKGLFNQYQNVSQQSAYQNTNQQVQSAVAHSLKGFKLSGVDLEGKDAIDFKEIQKRLSELTTQFSNNVLDSTMNWGYQTQDIEALAGCPEFVIQAAKAKAQEKQVDGYWLTLDLPIYMTVMTQADNRKLRETCYHAFTTRASETGPNAGKWDNTPLITEILALRTKLAKLLGFETFVDKSLAKKMAKNGEEVVSFLETLADKSKAYAENDWQEITQFAQDEYAIDDVKAWDVGYLSEKIKNKKYAVNKEMIRPYFPIDKVLGGLFETANKLYGIEITECDLKSENTWHKDVRYFDIKMDGNVIASFYLDIYARENKRAGAWMADCRQRRKTKLGLQRPVAFLVCNFNGASEGQPALLTHDDVTTLFHEFGHGLHHMLTQVEVSDVSGINGVEWDAVELPSQFMENFCWHKDTLKSMSEHVETKAPLSDELIEKMLTAKNFQSALQMLRQIEFALFDIRIHSGKGETVDVQKTINEVRAQVAIATPPEYNRFQNGFSHIFAGGYAAGYYSYKWAEVLSADVFSAFEEVGVFSKQMGNQFLKEILSQGGVDSAANLFENFRGRPPKVDALLRHSGLDK